MSHTKQVVGWLWPVNYSLLTLIIEHLWVMAGVLNQLRPHRFK